eukprot:1316373-Rhodomonas_salina.1
MHVRVSDRLGGAEQRMPSSICYHARHRSQRLPLPCSQRDSSLRIFGERLALFPQLPTDEAREAVIDCDTKTGGRPDGGKALQDRWPQLVWRVPRKVNSLSSSCGEFRAKSTSCPARVASSAQSQQPVPGSSSWPPIAHLSLRLPLSSWSRRPRAALVVWRAQLHVRLPSPTASTAASLPHSLHSHSLHSRECRERASASERPATQGVGQCRCKGRAAEST